MKQKQRDSNVFSNLPNKHLAYEHQHSFTDWIELIKALIYGLDTAIATASHISTDSSKVLFC